MWQLIFLLLIVQFYPKCNNLYKVKGEPSQRSTTGPMGQNGIKYTQMGQNGIKYTQMGQNGIKYTHKAVVFCLICQRKI